MRVWNLREDLARARALRVSGVWGERTIADHAREWAIRDPERVLLIDADQRLTAKELFDAAETLAQTFAGRGFRPGQVVSYMLPNWHETCVISLAATIAGLTLNPLLPIYREREMTFMLGEAESRALFVPAIYRNVDYRELTRGVRRNLPALEEVIVVRGPEQEFFSYQNYANANGRHAVDRVDADAIKMLIYTSGTTGHPKGVLHSHNTIMADIRSLAKFWEVSAADRFFVPSPVTHIGGSLYAHEFPWYSGTPAVLLDIWNGAVAARLIESEKCTISAGATPFLSDLVESCRQYDLNLPTLRLYACGGAAVPPDLIRSARAAFHACRVSRIYGSTEVPTVTGGASSDDHETLAAETDGALCGTEVRIVDPNTGARVVSDTEGELQVRGPEMFLNYTRGADTESAFTEDGYFRTGDLGRFVDGSHVVVTGRLKDLIIRAGENISPKEMEDLLGQHPHVADIAVVGVPSARTGEAACACVVLHPNTAISLADLAQFMIQSGAAKQKIPEALLVRDALPRTATGKIQKNILREEARTAAVWASNLNPDAVGQMLTSPD